MRATKRARRAAAVLALFLAAGCASSRSASQAPAAGMTPAEFETIYRAREDSARLRFGAADVRFMTHMIAHHAQALEMAALVPQRTATASIRTLAGRITNAQQDEIATMQQWLRDRAQPVPEVHVSGVHVVVHGAQHGAHMPGLLTAAQLEELAAARGPEFDRLFLRYMIHHHRGAVTMVAELFATDGAGQDEAVFKFASDVQVDQRTEIDRMERMLAALSAAGAP